MPRIVSNAIVFVLMCAAGLAAELPPGYDAIQESVRADKEAIDSLLRDFSCKHAYFDVGSSIGVQVRKLYEPDKYPKASVHSLFHATFGDAPRCSICSIEFEPNPRHAPQLAKVQSRLRAAGAPVLFLHAAAGAADGYVEFGRLSNITRRGQTDLSASANVIMQRRWSLKNKFAVRSVDMARVLRHVDARLREGALDAASRRIMMKLDVEGLEYAVLTHTVASQAICTVDLLVMEWHYKEFKIATKGNRSSLTGSDGSRGVSRDTAGISTVRKLTTELQHFFHQLLRAPTPDCRTRLVTMDDESYLQDGLSWPDATLCSISTKLAASSHT